MTDTRRADRVAALRGVRGPSWFGDLSPTVGRDLRSGLELEVDVTGRPSRVVRLDDLPDELREVDGLWEDAAEGWGYPGLFGFQDTLYAAGRLHRHVNAVLVNGAADGRAITATLARGLVEAAIAYENTSRFQLRAVQGMIDTFEDAAQLLDDHQVALLGYWSDQLTNLVDLAAAVMGEADELGDVGNWFTGGAGVVVQIMATAGSEAARILDTAVQYWVDLNVGKAGDWDSIQASLGSRGFEGDQWPDVTDVDLPYLNQPWELA